MAHKKLPPRIDRNTVTFPQVFLDVVDEFLKTETAITLGITSRPSFFIMCASALLSKYDKSLNDATKLFDITEDDLRAVLERIRAKSALD